MLFLSSDKTNALDCMNRPAIDGLHEENYHRAGWALATKPNMMKSRKNGMVLLWACGLVSLLRGGVTSGQEHASHSAQEAAGTVDFPVSCTAEAERAIMRGVALLHSFTYEEAALAFRDAAEKDPHCAMAHWGLAMTEYHQLWEPYAGPDELKRGSAEIQTARDLKPATPREKAYVEALGVFYEGWQGHSYETRAAAYRDAMKEVHERNPTDEEASVFYALALVATAMPDDKTYANQRMAAALLEPVFAGHPNHPGAAHYLIHAYDNPALAPQGVAAARAYAEIAPDLPHALHMPSHIFTRLGLWEDSIASNLAAAAAARRHNDPGEEFHALDYLVYAYLQLGQNGEAEKIRDHLPEPGNVKGSSLFKVNYAKAAIRARCALEEKNWAGAEKLVPDPGVQPQVAAISHWTAALGAAHAGHLEVARQHAEVVRRLSAELSKTGDAYWVEEVTVQGQEAAAWIALAEHRRDDALRMLRLAADHEDATEKHPVTPGAIRPARELLGDLLLELHQPKEALVAYQEVLAMEPGRRNAIEGVQEASRMANTTGTNQEKAPTCRHTPQNREEPQATPNTPKGQVILPRR
jgi:tetratricopeptide (TPR) repeat protein